MENVYFTKMTTTLCLMDSTIHNGNTWAAKLCSKKDGFYSLQPFVLPTEECNLGPGARLFRITQEGWDSLPTTSPSLAFPHVLHLLEKELNEQIWQSAALLLSSPLLPTNRATALLVISCLPVCLHNWAEVKDWELNVVLPSTYEHTDFTDKNIAIQKDEVRCLKSHSI